MDNYRIRIYCGNDSHPAHQAQTKAQRKNPIAAIENVEEKYSEHFLDASRVLFTKDSNPGYIPGMTKEEYEYWNDSPEVEYYSRYFYTNTAQLWRLSNRPRYTDTHRAQWHQQDYRLFRIAIFKCPTCNQIWQIDLSTQLLYDLKDKGQHQVSAADITRYQIEHRNTSKQIKR